MGRLRANAVGRAARRRRRLTTAVASVAVLGSLFLLDTAPAKFAREPSQRAPDLSRAKLLWSSGFEPGNFSEWDFEPQQKEKGRASVVTSVEGARPREGQYAMRVEVRPGDSGVAGSGSGERTELLIGGGLTGGQEGREAYWAWSTYFPRDFRLPIGAWNVFAQFHNTGEGGVQSNIHFDVRDRTTLGLRVLGGSVNSPARKDFILADLVRGRWYDFVFHVTWSADGRVGFVEVFLDGWQIVPKTYTPTLYTGQGVYFKAGYYRAAHNETSVVYMDAIRRFEPR